MLRSLLPFAKLFESPLRRSVPTLSTTSKFFFATTPVQKNNTAGIRKPNFPPPPELEPMEEGDEQDRMPLTNATYLETIGEKLYKNRRSAYAAVERRGKIYHLYDAERIPVGRIVQEIVRNIQGKQSPLYRHDRIVEGLGDTCVIVNADKMKFTGQKAFQKSIKYHTGYIGHLRTIPYKRMILEKPEQLIMRTIYKMLPKNKLREEYLKNVKIYRGPTHPLTHFLPNFGYIEENYDALVSKVRGDYLNSEEYKVTYETTPGTFEEFKDYERDIDLSYERPFREENVKTPNSAKNKALLAEHKKYKRLLRRYKEYKVKQPKYKDIVKEAKTETVFVDRDWKYKKLGLHKLGGDEDDPDED